MKCGFLLLLFLFNFGILCYGKFNGNRIINGDPAAPEKYQNVARIIPMTLNASKAADAPFIQLSVCTSTLISKRHLLTAAHCVTDIQHYLQEQLQALNANKMLTIAAAMIDFRPEDPSLPYKYYLKKNGLATKFIYHPDWKVLPFHDDVAIIELPAEVTDIEPVLLARDYEERGNDIGINVGYGDMDPNPGVSKMAQTLMEITVPILPKKECIFAESYLLNIICAGTNLKRSDHGDSGGPLFFDATDGKQYQIGIAHSLAMKDGSPAGPTGEPDFVAYMRISEYCDWIEETTKNETRCVEMGKRSDAEAQNGAMANNMFIIIFAFIFAYLLTF